MDDGSINKYIFNSTLDSENDPLPYQFRHIRSGPRSVRPEYYVLTHKLKSQYHMSETQVQGSILSTFNILFKRKEYG